MKITFFLIAGLASALSCNGSSATTAEVGSAKKKENDKVEVAKAKEATLKNGLRVVVVPTDSHGFIAYGLIYHVGALDDPEDKVGLSHFLEHMMFNGTRRLSKERLDFLTDKYCQDFNAGTGYHSTSYYGVVRKELLPWALKIEADRMKNLKFDSKECERERAVIINETTMRSKSDPIYRHLAPAWKRSYFLQSREAVPAGGEKRHVENITLTSLKKHYKTYYVPNNAVLVLVGSVELDEAVQLANKVFGHIRPSKKRMIRVKQEEPLNTGIIVSLDRSGPDISKRDLTLQYVYDRALIRTYRQRLVAGIVFDMLNDPSVLSRILVDEKKLLEGVSASLFPNETNKWGWQVSCSLNADTDVEVVKREINAILDLFVERYCTQALLDKFREQALIGLKFAMDDPTSYFCTISAIIFDYPLEDFNQRLEIYRNITLNEVKNLAKSLLLQRCLSHVVYIHPEGGQLCQRPIKDAGTEKAEQQIVREVGE